MKIPLKESFCPAKWGGAADFQAKRRRRAQLFCRGCQKRHAPLVYIKQACGGKVNFINRFVKLSPWRAWYYFLIIRAHFCALVSTSLKLTLSGSLYV